MKYEYKGFNIVGDGTFSMCAIKSLIAGPVPVPLRGHYTKSTEAEKAINSYISTEDAKVKRPKKVKLNAPATNTG